MSNAGRTLLLFGRTGQIGGALVSRLAGDWTVVALGRDDVDLNDLDSVRVRIRETKPAVIVNAAAYTAVDRAEREPAMVHVANAAAVEAMADVASEVGAAIVHFSTDYVFDGTKRSPYLESDPVAPINVYGASKAAGDANLTASGIPHLIFRTTWVYSASGQNFLRAIVRRAEAGELLRVVDDQVGAPTSASAIATACADILRSFSEVPKPAEAIEPNSGIYNMTAGGRTTWYDFACAILDRLGYRQSVARITTTDLKSPARRPAYSILDNSQLARVFGVRLTDWENQLSDVIIELRKALI